MSKDIDFTDLIDEVKNKIYTQDYSIKKEIEGVKLIELKSIVSEEGDFSEIARFLNGKFEGVPDFNIAQINRTKLNPQSIKAWHLHFRQDELWYLVPSDHLVVGLWDVRENSRSKNVKIKVCLGEGKSQLLFIPHGVAHGSVNLIKKPVELFYFVNEQFDIKNPDEKRIPWDTLGNDFWLPERD